MRWWLAALCILAGCCEGSWENSTCYAPDLSLTPNCGRYIEGLGISIPSDYNETDLDNAALLASQVEPKCPYFDLEFQCLKYFFRCEETADGEVTVQGMCQESCKQAKEWDTNRICHDFDFDKICSNPKFFDKDPLCFALPDAFGRKQLGGGWKLALILILVFVALAVIVSLVYAWWKAKKFNENPDESIEFDDERKAADKAAVKKMDQGDNYVNLDISENSTENERRKWTSAQEARQKVKKKDNKRRLASHSMSEPSADLGSDVQSEADEYSAEG